MTDRQDGRRLAPVLLAGGLLTGALLLLSNAGCGMTAACTTAVAVGGSAVGTAALVTAPDTGTTQVQFFSPPGAVVTVRDSSQPSRPIVAPGAFDNRLEQAPEQYCMFNLSPGKTYEFKYTSAEGLPGVSLYGELEVHYAHAKETRIFRRLAFIPISLPSEYYQHQKVDGNEVFPYRGEAFRTAIDEWDLHRLQQGDVVEKVFLVADLEQAKDRVLDTERDIAVTERKLEYAEARFKRAYWDFQIDIDNPVARFFRKDRDFIECEEDRQEVTQDLEELHERMKRTKALLKGDHVLIRNGMLVLATEEVVEPYRDVTSASGDVGEVLLVMRVGGRHQWWGDERRELAAKER